MLRLAELGAVASVPGRNAPVRVPCATVDQAVRILSALADTEIRCAPDVRARALTAVIDWILVDQQDRADVRAGMARMMIDAALIVGKSSECVVAEGAPTGYREQPAAPAPAPAVLSKAIQSGGTFSGAQNPDGTWTVTITATVNVP